MINISYIGCERRTPKDAFYQEKFKDFKTDEIYVSERSPMSPKNGGFDARRYWRRADEEEARQTFYPVFFKNASWYGASQYYIKDRFY